METSAGAANFSDPYNNRNSSSFGSLGLGLGINHHNTNTNTNNNTNDPTRRYLTAANFIRYPLSAILEYSGLLRTTTNPSRSDTTSSDSTQTFINAFQHRSSSDDFPSPPPSPPPPPTTTTTTTAGVGGGGGGEVSIRIIGSSEQDHVRIGAATVTSSSSPLNNHHHNHHHHALTTAGDNTSPSDATAQGLSLSSQPTISTSNPAPDDEEATNGGLGANTRDSSYQRYDIQQVARWIEQILPFSLLLLVVFIRQHLQGFFVTIWVAAVMFKSNDVLRKQTALKGERIMSVLVGISIGFMVHVVGIYWWFRNDDLLYPLVMLPPKTIPPFWHAIFTIMVNDTMVRQAAMVLKCILLMYFKNSRGRNYRKQGQMLTLVEYMLLLYRALLPAPVWYRFFLNKEYGSLFSSLTTGLYLTFKLTSVVEKVQSFLAALKALSRKEVHYGSYATSEQVNSAGDLCAICQEKMHAPILLRCKHIFCEDCVSEWFERERTCPLCRALVKPADLKSFGDGSTSLFFQLF